MKATSKTTEYNTEGSSKEPSYYKKGKMTRAGRSLLACLIVILVIASFCVVTYLTTPLFMVHPVYSEEAASRLSRYNDVLKLSFEMDPEDHEQLSGYMLDRPDTDNLIIYFGGISDDSAQMILQLHDQDIYSDFAGGYDIVMIDWPEYGMSSGQATDSSLKEAAVQIVNHFSKTYNDPSIAGDDTGDRKVILMAYSMGTGPAVYAASCCDTDGLILVAPYASSDDLYNSVVNIFHGPFRYLLSYHMDTDQYAQDVTENTLIIASLTDMRVPYASSVKLSECFAGDVQFVSIDNVSHGDMPSDPNILTMIERFLH